MDGKLFVVCNTEKSIDNFYNKYKNANHAIISEV